MTCIGSPLRSWRSRAIARAANTTVRWASMESRWWWKIGRARGGGQDMDGRGTPLWIGS
jgi:hypothetical protein